jgi:hypothetical protein
MLVRKLYGRSRASQVVMTAVVLVILAAAVVLSIGH